MSIIDAVIKLDVGAISLFLGLISICFGILAIFFIKINIDALKRQNETAIKSERNERFKNAIEQLGNDKNAVVLGGIYTLHRIAKEDESYIENVFNILCAYVRETTTAEDYQKKYKEKPSEPIQTILNILCVKGEDLKIYRTVNLFVDFYGAYLRGAYLRNVNLTGAYLYDANLTGAILHDANLTGVYLYKATLTGAYLCKATLTGAFLLETTLTGADLSEAILVGANLSEATFTGANLINANLKGACSLKKSYITSFEERIKSRIGKEHDLSGIKGYNSEKQPFHGDPEIGAYTKEEAEEIIKKYRDSRSPKSIEN